MSRTNNVTNDKYMEIRFVARIAVPVSDFRVLPRTKEIGIVTCKVVPVSDFRVLPRTKEIRIVTCKVDARL